MTMTTVAVTTPEHEHERAQRRDERLRNQWATQVEDWIREGQPSALAPEDWGASGSCARLMARSMRRYATTLGGDLTHAEVLRDLQCTQAFIALLLHAAQTMAKLPKSPASAASEPPASPKKRARGAYRRKRPAAVLDSEQGELWAS